MPVLQEKRLATQLAFDVRAELLDEVHCFPRGRFIKVILYVHCVAMALAIPVYVLLRSFALSGPGGIFQMRCSLPLTMLVGCRLGKFLSHKQVSLGFAVTKLPRLYNLIVLAVTRGHDANWVFYGNLVNWC